MGCAYAYLILGTYHAERFHATYLGFLDLELLTFGTVQSGAHGGYHYGLSGVDVGRATHDLGGFPVAEVYGGDVEMVAVGVLHACEHFAYYDSAEASAYGFYLFYSACLKTYRGERCGHFRGSEIEVEVFFKPIIGNIHKKNSFSVGKDTNFSSKSPTI